ncbi:MAG TPA: tripartite tricarboxylate transporter substrate binding protein [Alphaproteobacteria bacterium]
MRGVRRGLLVVAFTMVAAGAAAQTSYPTRPVRVLIGFPPGTAADVTGRLVSQKLSQTFGQQFVVENRPGASSTIAAEMVVRAPKDGYTLLLGSVANTINATMLKDLSYSFENDLAPVALVTTAPNILVVHPSLPVHTVQELIAYAKPRPGEIFYASSGNGTSPHLSGELFNLMAGVKLAHVPYKGSSDAVTDLLAGRVTVTFSPVSTVLPHIASGKLRALATTGSDRAAAMPELPTVAESGLPGYETSLWFGVLAPASTPRDVVERLAAAIDQALASPDMGAQLAAQGMTPAFRDPQAFAALIHRDTEKWAKVVVASGAKLD